MKTNYDLGQENIVYQSNNMKEYQPLPPLGEYEFENPRPAILGPNNTEFQHNNSGKQNTFNPITGEVQISKAQAPKEKNKNTKFNLVTNEEKDASQKQSVFDGF